MNLWADFANNMGDQDGRSSHISSRARRLTEQMVLATLRSWLLTDYVPPYCRSLAASRIFRRCYWIDALGSDAKAAQATLLESIAALSTMLAAESKPLSLHRLVLEAGSSRRKGEYSTHVAEGKPLVLPQGSGLVRASWIEASAPLLALLDTVPALFLLNPFGRTLFRYEHLLPLYQRTAPTELVLLLSHRQIEMSLLAAQHDTAQASALTALLRSDRWKALAVGEEALGTSVETIIDLFIASMQHHFVFPVQRIMLPIQVRPAVVEMVPYSVLFATRRQDSLLSMNTAVCLYRRRVYEQSHRGVLAEEWFAAQQQERFEQAFARATERVLQMGRAQRIRRWPDLRQQLILANFGQFTLQEYDHMISLLLRRSEVRCEWKKKHITEDESIAREEHEKRVPGNEDALLWT